MLLFENYRVYDFFFFKSRKTWESVGLFSDERRFFFIGKVGELEHAGSTPCIRVRVLEKIVAVELGAS